MHKSNVQESLAKLQELADLPDLWLDGIDGKKIAPAFIARAKQLVDLFDGRDIGRYYIFPTAEGGLDIEWHLPQAQGEIMASWYIEDDGEMILIMDFQPGQRGKTVHCHGEPDDVFDQELALAMLEKYAYARPPLTIKQAIQRLEHVSPKVKQRALDIIKHNVVVQWSRAPQGSLQLKTAGGQNIVVDDNALESLAEGETPI